MNSAIPNANGTARIRASTDERMVPKTSGATYERNVSLGAYVAAAWVRPGKPSRARKTNTPARAATMTSAATRAVPEKRRSPRLRGTAWPGTASGPVRVGVADKRYSRLLRCYKHVDAGTRRAGPPAHRI